MNFKAIINGLRNPKNTEGKLHTFSVTQILLSHLGVTNKTDLPNYAAVLDQLERFEQQVEEENT